MTSAGRRQDRLIQERVHDPYKNRRKPPEAAFCPKCGVVFRDGRWQWAESRPIDGCEVLCQACKRVADRFPGGQVIIRGAFLSRHRNEILNLVRNVQALETADHPMHRVMTIEGHSDSIIVNTTDVHLPRRIGEALRRAHKGELDMHYEEGGYFLRALWRRELE